VREEQCAAGEYLSIQEGETALESATVENRKKTWIKSTLAGCGYCIIILI
jgi:hypothetical protein